MMIMAGCTRAWAQCRFSNSAFSVTHLIHSKVQIETLEIITDHNTLIKETRTLT